MALQVKNLLASTEDIGKKKKEDIEMWVWSLSHERSPVEGHGNPLQYSCLENPMEEEPSGLQSIGSQRVGRNWSDFVHTHAQITKKSAIQTLIGHFGGDLCSKMGLDSPDSPWWALLKPQSNERKWITDYCVSHLNWDSYMEFLHFVT